MAKKDNEEIPFTAGPGSGASEKLKALQAAMDKIEKNFGKGSIMKLGDENVQQVGYPDRFHRLERCTRCRRLSEGKNHRDIRP